MPPLPDHFNVFKIQYELMQTDYFAGSDAGGRILFESADRRHLVIATHYPRGVRFRYGAEVTYQEAFYIVQGSGTRRYADGSTLPIEVGDLIYVRPGADIDYVYDPGLIDVAFFWSEDEPLDATLGLGVRDRTVPPLP